MCGERSRKGEKNTNNQKTAPAVFPGSQDKEMKLEACERGKKDK